MNKLISTKNRVFMSMVGPSESGKTQLIYECLISGTFQPKFDKIYFLHQYYHSLYNNMQKEMDCIEFVKGVNFELIDSLKNNGTKYLLFFDDSCEEVCSSKEFVNIAQLEDTVDLALYTLNTTCFTRARSDAILSYKLHTLHCSKCPGMLCK